MLLVAGGLYYRLHRKKPLTAKDAVVLGDFSDSTVLSAPQAASPIQLGRIAFAAKAAYQSQLLILLTEESGNNRIDTENFCN